MYLLYNDKGDIVKVLSIRDPYASLIKLKIKTIETRSFKTNYRGELYIHASLSKSNVGDELNKLVMPMYGKIICKCKLVDCVLMTKEYVKYVKDNMPMEYKCGLYEEGRYAWILKDIEEIDAIKAKGKLGIWSF